MTQVSASGPSDIPVVNLHKNERNKKCQIKLRIMSPV